MSAAELFDTVMGPILEEVRADRQAESSGGLSPTYTEMLEAGIDLVLSSALVGSELAQSEITIINSGAASHVAGCELLPAQPKLRARNHQLSEYLFAGRGTRRVCQCVDDRHPELAALCERISENGLIGEQLREPLLQLAEARIRGGAQAHLEASYGLVEWEQNHPDHRDEYENQIEARLGEGEHGQSQREMSGRLLELWRWSQNELGELLMLRAGEDSPERAGGWLVRVRTSSGVLRELESERPGALTRALVRTTLWRDGRYSWIETDAGVAAAASELNGCQSAAWSGRSSAGALSPEQTSTWMTVRALVEESGMELRQALRVAVSANCGALA